MDWVKFLESLQANKNVAMAARSIGRKSQVMCDARRVKRYAVWARKWDEITGPSAARVASVRPDGTVGGALPAGTVMRGAGGEMQQRASKIRKYSYQKAFEDVALPQGVARVAARLIARADAYEAWLSAGCLSEPGVHAPEPLTKDELKFLSDQNRTYAGTLMKEGDGDRGPTISDLAALSEPEIRAALARVRKEREAFEILRAKAEAIPAVSEEIGHAP